MKGIAIAILGFALLAAPLPAQADEERSWTLEEILQLGGRALTGAITRGLAEITDHVEIEGRMGPGRQEGERSSRLRLKIFPKGKHHPEEQIGAETQLEYSLDPRRPHFRFDVRITPRQEPDDYI